jgi:hypothetical protein
MADDKHLATLRDYYKRVGAFPSIPRLCDVVGLSSTSSVFALIGRLSSAGYVARIDGRVVPTRQFFARPLLGPVRAGQPQPADQSEPEVVTLDDYLIDQPNRTSLHKVRGDSMRDVGILEGDQASVDTRASLQTEESYDPDDPDYTPPAVINGLIREIIGKFSRCAFIGYTATPFANILIPHEQYDPKAGLDLYPKDFFIDLPKPSGYFGTEEFFGRFDPSNDERIEGLQILRPVEALEIATLIQNNEITPLLDEAICAFVLGGAARALRGKPDAPCTMLIHTSHLTARQGALHPVRAHEQGHSGSDCREEPGWVREGRCFC